MWARAMRSGCERQEWAENDAGGMGHGAGRAEKDGFERGVVHGWGESCTEGRSRARRCGSPIDYFYQYCCTYSSPPPPPPNMEGRTRAPPTPHSPSLLQPGGLAVLYSAVQTRTVT